MKLCGEDIYRQLIKGYTEKQWGRSATELPAFIIKRIPFRFIFDNNYFNDPYQCIPVGGYNRLIDALLEGIEVRTGIDYMEHRKELDPLAATYNRPIIAADLPYAYETAAGHDLTAFFNPDNPEELAELMLNAMNAHFERFGSIPQITNTPLLINGFPKLLEVLLQD